MLLCDAWFDVVTSTSRRRAARSRILEAVFAELPLAALCAWIVVDTKRFHEAILRRMTSRRAADPPMVGSPD